MKRGRDLFVAADASVDWGGVTTGLVDPPLAAASDKVPVGVAEFVSRTRRARDAGRPGE